MHGLIGFTQNIVLLGEFKCEWLISHRVRMN